MNVTLSDVAKAAGVSKATVDRVLHGRGKVRANTVERVHRAMYSTEYCVEPETAENTEDTLYRFDFLLPADDSLYFDGFAEIISEVSQIFTAHNTTVHIHQVENFQPDLLAEKLLKISENSDGIAFVALDAPVIRSAIEQVQKNGTPVVSFVSDITGSERTAYVGIDNRAAGRTAGNLMGRFIGSGQKGSIALLPGSYSYCSHGEREIGFKSILHEKYPNLKIISLPEGGDNNAKTCEIMKQALSDQPDLLGIYNVGGGTVGLVNALKDTGNSEQIVLLAHELRAATREFLIDGTIDAIINQDRRHEAYNAIEILLHHAKGQKETASIRMPHVEIFIQDNIV